MLRFMSFLAQHNHFLKAEDHAMQILEIFERVGVAVLTGTAVTDQNFARDVGS